MTRTKTFGLFALALTLGGCASASDQATPDDPPVAGDPANSAGDPSAADDDTTADEGPIDPFAPEEEDVDDALVQANGGDAFTDTATETTLPSGIDHIESAKANTDSYNITGWRYVADAQACLKYNFSGKVTYTSEKLAMLGGQTAYRLRHITFVAPKTTATVYRYDPGIHACTTRAFKVSKLKVSDVLSGYSCSWNPQVSVGAPFGVSLGFWPSCGNRRSARLTGSVSHKSGIIQANQDTRIHYVDQAMFTQSSTPPKFRCYGAALKATVTEGHVSATVKSPRRKICLTPKW